MADWISTYKKTIVSTLIVVGIVILSFCLVYGILNGNIKQFISDFLTIVSPIIIGFVIAYLSNPIVTFFERKILFWIPRFKLKRLLSIIVTLALIILFIAFILTMLLPSLLSTIQSFWDTYVINYEYSIKELAIRINTIMDGFEILDMTQRIDPDALISWIKSNLPWLDNIVDGNFSEIMPSDPNKTENSDIASDFDLNSLLSSDSLMSALQYALSFSSSLFNIVKDTVLGIFIAVYMLMSKETCKAAIRRFLNSFLHPRHVRSIVRFGKLLDRSFGGFIEGQLLDAIVVGIVSYFIFYLFGLPIPHLLATIIAVTNVIPIFGPFIGGIPAAFLVLLTAPEKTLLFVILILIIQQIDGNIICPHILGDRINISSLATIIAIVTMGGLYGIFGMLIGVPVFAVVIQTINNYTINALRRKGFETSLNHYHVGNPESLSKHSSNHNKKNKFLTSVKNITSKLMKNKKKDKQKEK